MTAIAYRDGVIAADSEASLDDEIKVNSCIKLGSHNGYIFGLAGDDIPVVETFVKWFFNPKRKSMPKFKFDAIVVGPDRKIMLVDQGGQAEEIAEPFFAIGSGRQVCMGAMENDATAEKAVTDACKWAVGVSGPVRTLRL